MAKKELWHLSLIITAINERFSVTRYLTVFKNHNYEKLFYVCNYV